MRNIVLGIITIVLVLKFLPPLKKDHSVDSHELATTFTLGKRNPAGLIDHQFQGFVPQTNSPNHRTAPPLMVTNSDDLNTHRKQPESKSTSLLESIPLPPALIGHDFEQLIDPQSAPSSRPSHDQEETITFYNTSLAGRSSPLLPQPPIKKSASAKKPPVITGVVKPLVGHLVSISPWENAFTAWASTNCQDPKVGIYKTSELLNLGVSPLKEISLGTDATYTFHPDAQINTSRPQDYSLQVSGCDNYLSRIVTAFDENQHIHLASTLLSFSQVSPVNISPTQIPNNEFQSLLGILEKYESSFTSIMDVFEALNSGLLSDQFVQSFQGSAPEQLKFALPVIKEVIIPEEFSEGSAAVLTVESSHWYPDYQIGVEWYLNGVSTSFGTLWNWTPSGNSPREVKISVRIGTRKENEDRVDTTYPYHQLSFTRGVINTIQPLAPAVALDSLIPNLINTPHLPLKILTGADFIHCDSFSSLAITEIPVEPNLEDFNIICSQEEVQNVLYSLSTESSSTDGTKSLYLWAKDDLDEISLIPSVLSFILDQTPPILSIDPMSTNHAGNSAIELKWMVKEQHAVNSENFLIEFFNGSHWITLPTIAPVSGTLDDLSLSTSFILPDEDITNARFRLTYADVLGQTASISSSTFNIRVPKITSSPLSYNFGDIPAQSLSDATTITFTNNGEWPSIACSTPSLSGEASQFSIVSENCSGTFLSALGGSCQVIVRANPNMRQAYNSSINLSCGTKMANATLMVTGQNNPPDLASSMTTILDEDTPHFFNLTAATDLDGDELTYTIVSGPTNGSISSCLAGTNDLSCVYTPSANYFGSDSFTYHAFDGFNYSPPQTVHLTINSINDAPVISATHSLVGNEDTAINFSLHEATDVENDSLTYSIVTHPQHATVNCSGRDCILSPNSNFHGSDNFSYKANDGALDSTIVTVTVTINGVNDPPIAASNFSLTAVEDTPTPFNLTAGTDVDLPAQTLTHMIVNAPVNGILSGCIETGPGTDLSCTYTANENYHGSDTFTYRVCDPIICSSSTTTVTITVTPVNDPPVIATSQSLTGDEDNVINFSLNEGTDTENDPLTYSIVTAPLHGIVNCTVRNCSYTPNTHYYGSDSFTYKVNDGNLDSAVATATITINPINDTPIPANDFSLAVTEDTPTLFNLVSGTDVDLPAETLTHMIVSAPMHGTLSGCIEAAAGTDLSCTYTPATNYHGSDSFTYRVCDSFVCSSAVTTVTLTIEAVNDAPVMIADQNFTLDDNQHIDIVLNGANDIDIPAQSLSYQIVTMPSQGSLTGCIDNTSWSTGLNCRFTPPSNFNGTISFTYRAFDGNLHSTNISTVTFNVSDKTPSPIANISLASAYYSNQTNVTVTNGHCTDIDSLYISTNSTPPQSSDSGWLPCTTSVGALSTVVDTINGVKTVYVWSKDQFGNVQSTADSVEMIFDNTPPSLNILTKTLLGNNIGDVSFNVTELHASSAQSFQIRYHDGSSWSNWTLPSLNGPFNNQTFSTAVTVPSIDAATLIFEVKYTDLAGNEGSISANIISDLTIPTVTSFTLNGGVAQTANNNILVSLTAQDNTSDVRYFCLKYNNATAPAADSSCWRDVTAPSPGIVASKNITFSDFYFQIGFIKATYSVYVWVKDEVGLISNNSQTPNIDLFEIDYDPGSPPRILAIEAVNSNNPQRPNLPVDLTISQGQDVFVKWKAEDNEGFAVNPIAIEYSLNDVDFFPIPGAGNLQNNANGACTVDIDFTGCAVVPSPSSDYYKIRVIAKDHADTTVYLNSEPLNNSRLRIIAGNTEHGLGGSAKTAIYYTYGSSSSVSSLMKSKLAISEDGKFFYLDPQRGLLWIDPSSGSLQTFIPSTGASTGDGGHIANATLTSAKAITLDAYNNLLIWDNDRIRKVQLSSMTISTIIGGGASTSPTAVISGLAMKLGIFDTRWGTIIPLPNGDIIFSPETSTRNPYRYRANDQMVEPMILSGQGFDLNPTADWALHQPIDFAVTYDTTSSAISFMAKGFYKSYTGDSYSHYVRILPTGNATTPYPSSSPYDLAFHQKSIFTALDGKLYLVDRFRRQIFQYDPITNIKTAIAGTAASGTRLCPEDTPALSCAMDIDSIFIAKNGRVYFIDQGVIRTIDDNKNVISLFGQHRGYGDGQLASISRFGNIVDLKFGKHSSNNDHLIISDAFSGQYREFQIDGLTTDLGTNGYSWSGPFRFETDPATGDIMAPRGGGLQRLIRASGTWTTIVGGGGTRYFAADGLLGSDIYFSSYAAHTSGFVDGKLYYRTYYWTGGQNQACQIKAYDSNDFYRQSHFMGTSTNYCAGSYSLGSNLASQYIATYHITSFVDPTDDVKKIFFTGPNGKINRVGAGNTLEEFLILPRSFTNFSHHHAVDGFKIYYCSGNNLYQYHYDTAEETQLSWPSTTIKCKGATLYNPERNSVIFSFSQNGLDGVAEYRLD